MHRQITRSWLVAAQVALFVSISLTPLVAEEPSSSSRISWLNDYGFAMELAKDQQKMLFIYFYNPEEPDIDRLESWASQTDDFAAFSESIVFCKVATDATATADGKEFTLLKHSSFREMLGRPGIAMIDCVEPDSDTFGRVVSVYPVSGQRQLSQQALTTLARLPRGTLTQRTLVLAVALHRDRPRSVSGRWNPILAEESESHSSHQARIRVQGHHNWGSRFHRIIGRLGGRLGTQEVCAESWPGQNLVEAAEECVASWRQSPGHWSAVSSSQSAFAYDMKRGSDGVWYATGLFAK